MPRGSLFLLLCTAALGQVPPSDPFDRAMQLSNQVRNQGNFAEAAARRDEARAILDKMPAGSPQWAGRVQSLAQLYQGSGWHTKARALTQDALSRTAMLPEWSPVRLQLLDSMAGLWQQDGNLLKALAYREKAVAGFESAPPGAPAQTAPAPSQIVAGSLVSGVRALFTVSGRLSFPSGQGPNNTYLYERLADVYRQLGRPQAAAQARAKMRSLITDDPAALAASYEKEGDLDQARTFLRRQAAGAAAKPQSQPWEVVSPLQSIASLYEREDRWAEAADTLQQAAAYLDASSRPEARNQSVNLRLQLASLLQQSGRSQAADQMYQALLNQAAGDSIDQQVQVIQGYANQLSQTERGGQAIQILKDYLAGHHDLQPWQETNLLFALAQSARQAGQTGLADQYQREAQEKQRAAMPRPPDTQQDVGPKLQKAQIAANQGKIEEAFSLVLEAIADSATAPDAEQIAWQAPQIASALAGKDAPEKAEQVFRALFPVLEARSADNAGSPNEALQRYAQFLISRKDRLNDAALAINRYRDSLVAAQGAETTTVVQSQQLRIELARAKNAPGEAVQAAEELLAGEESLAGATSAPYLRAAQTAAEVFRASGMTDRALMLHRHIVAIADLAIPPDDLQRGFVRMNAAMAFASARQFDEAERLAQEAIAVGQAMHPPRADLFVSQAEQIQKMKAGEISDGLPGGRAGAMGRGFIASPTGTLVAPNGWYVKTAPAPPPPR